MGQATILEALGEGRYRVRLEYDTRLLEARIAEAVGRRQGLMAAQSEAAALEVDRRVALRQAQAVLNGLIDDFAAGLIERAAVSEATAAALLAAAEYEAVVFRRKSLDAQLLALSLSLDGMERLRTLPEPERVLWCADFSEDVSGVVGTIELTGEPLGEDPAGLLPVLHPGWEGNAAWRCERDGVYLRQQANGLFASLVDGVLLAAWQTHRPRHRLAQLVAIDAAADTCSVVIDSALSSVQGLSIDPFDPVLLTQSGVPVVYMDCNSAAFAVGDRVVVAFGAEGWSDPMVIGFEREPVACSSAGLCIVPLSDVAVLGWMQPFVGVEGTPYSLMADLPLELDQERLFRRQYSPPGSGEWLTYPGYSGRLPLADEGDIQCGNRSWRRGEVVISWFGPLIPGLGSSTVLSPWLEQTIHIGGMQTSRHEFEHVERSGNSRTDVHNAGSIYFAGVEYELFDGGRGVSAAIAEDAAGESWLVVMRHVSVLEEWAYATPVEVVDGRLVFVSDVGQWVVLGSHVTVEPGQGQGNQYIGYEWNASGNEAVTYHWQDLAHPSEVVSEKVRVIARVDVDALVCVWEVRSAEPHHAWFERTWHQDRAEHWELMDPIYWLHSGNGTHNCRCRTPLVFHFSGADSEHLGRSWAVELMAAYSGDELVYAVLSHSQSEEYTHSGVFAEPGLEQVSTNNSRRDVQEATVLQVVGGPSNGVRIDLFGESYANIRSHVVDTINDIDDRNDEPRAGAQWMRAHVLYANLADGIIGVSRESGALSEVGDNPATTDEVWYTGQSESVVYRVGEGGGYTPAIGPMLIEDDFSQSVIGPSAPDCVPGDGGYVTSSNGPLGGNCEDDPPEPDCDGPLNTCDFSAVDDESQSNPSGYPDYSALGSPLPANPGVRNGASYLLSFPILTAPGLQTYNSGQLPVIDGGNKSAGPIRRI